MSIPKYKLQVKTLGLGEQKWPRSEHVFGYLYLPLVVDLGPCPVFSLQGVDGASVVVQRQDKVVTSLKQEQVMGGPVLPPTYLES